MRLRMRTTLPAILLVAAASFPGTASSAMQQQITVVPQQEGQSAAVVREDFRELLAQSPDTVRNLLRVDPSLMLNEEFMAPYPALADFIDQHPEIPRNPIYFVGEPVYPFFVSPRSAADELAEALTFIAIFSMILFGMVWIVRTVVGYRRWSRLSRIQTEVHTKLLDRFTSMEDLQSYFNSPAGRRFLEAAPIDLSTESVRTAPAGRILWSLQVGIVLALGGLGLHVAIQGLADGELADPLRVMGTIAVALGLGFVLSAGASSILSSRLGLLSSRDKDRPPARSD